MPPHHGSAGADLLCGPFATPDLEGVVGCEAAIWQQGVDSDFINPLNADYEAAPEVDYTAIYTRFDDVLPSNAGPLPTSALDDDAENVVNITLQDVCPAMANHRAIGTFDPVGFAIALDALVHDGPASLDRGAPSASPVCSELVIPGVDPLAFEDHLALHDEAVAMALADGMHLVEEPAPACYTRGNGPAR